MDRQDEIENPVCLSRNTENRVQKKLREVARATGLFTIAISGF